MVFVRDYICFRPTWTIYSLGYVQGQDEVVNVLNTFILKSPDVSVCRSEVIDEVMP